MPYMPVLADTTLSWTVKTWVDSPCAFLPKFVGRSHAGTTAASCALNEVSEGAKLACSWDRHWSIRACASRACAGCPGGYNLLHFRPSGASYCQQCIWKGTPITLTAARQPQLPKTSKGRRQVSLIAAALPRKIWEGHDGSQGLSRPKCGPARASSLANKSLAPEGNSLCGLLWPLKRGRGRREHKPPCVPLAA